MMGRSQDLLQLNEDDAALCDELALELMQVNGHAMQRNGRKGA